MEVIDLDAICESCLKVTGGAHLSDVDDDTIYEVAQAVAESTNKEGKLCSDQIQPLHCTSCKKCAVLKFHDNFYSIGALLTAKHKKDGIHELDEEENPFLLLLMTVCYNECEREGRLNESPFLCSLLLTDIVKLIWKAGQAMGFYILKVKGSTLSLNPPTVLRLPVLDAVYVRRVCRRQGLGLAVVEDIVRQTLGETAPPAAGQNLGITEPLSTSLLKVLESYLALHPEFRDSIWSSTYTGEDGYRKNIWLDLQRMKRLCNQERIAVA